VVGAILEACATGKFLNTSDVRGNTALHVCAACISDDSVATARMLVGAGANLFVKNLDRMTPLEVAIISRNSSLVELFRYDSGNMKDNILHDA